MRLLTIAVVCLSSAALAQEPPLECDNNYGECGTPEMSGGGQGGGGSVLIANTDLGDTYQSADDYDDDGVEDSYDNCPRKPNREQFDGDGDGVGDLCDNCRDTHNINQWDLDGDGRGDLCDHDMDNDGISNAIDNCLRVFNTDQSNIDNDDDGDACDRDIDGDGLDNLVDPCPMREGDPTEDSEWCAPDLDGDGVPDYGFSSDNCPGVHNPNQYDTDLDGAGDACDPDLDGDGVGNLIDNCNGIFNASQIDEDRDGRGDEGCDDRFCYVVFGDEENCLDPEGSPRVYSPNVTVNTGDSVSLRVFTNRPEQDLKYTWSVKKRMGGSKDTVKNPVGETSGVAVFEHKVESRPTFSPSFPGEYILNLSVELEGGETIQHDVTILVGGAALPQAEVGGCNQSPSSTPAFLALALLMIPAIRRRL